MGKGNDDIAIIIIFVLVVFLRVLVLVGMFLCYFFFVQEMVLDRWGFVN